MPQNTFGSGNGVWLGDVSQQPITWAGVDPDLCHNMATLGPTELFQYPIDVQNTYQLRKIYHICQR